MRRLLIILFLVFAPFLGVKAQDNHYAIRNYTAVDGLPQSQVCALAEDDNGYLWLGTLGGGLARFDGREFHVYTTLDGLLSNFVIRLLIDNHQNLWIVHYRGVTRFDGSTFTKFPIPNGGKHRKPGGIYVQGDTLHIFRYPEEHISIYQDSIHWTKPVFSDPDLIALFKSPISDDVYGLMQDRQFVLFDGQTRCILDDGFSRGRRREIFMHGEEVWVIKDNKLLKVNRISKRLEELPFTIDHHILLYDEREDVFWTADSHHLFKERISAERKTIDTVLTDVSVASFLIDAEGNYWIGTNGRGLFKSYAKDFDRCSSKNLQGTMAIHVDRFGDTWVGTMTNGLWRISDGNVTSYLNDVGISTIKEDPSGTLWVGTDMGMGKYHRESDVFTWYTSKAGDIPYGRVRNFDFDETGKMWIGLDHGLCTYDGEQFRPYPDTVLSKLQISAIKYSPFNRTLFIGTDFGVVTLHKKSLGKVEILDNTGVLSFDCFRDSLVLIGMGGGGLLIHSPKTQKNRSITTRDGLTSDFIYFVAQDSSDFIWVGTEKGITRLKLDHQLQIVENLHYGYDNGLIGVETNHNAYYLGKDNKYFGLIDGLYQFNELEDKDKKSFNLHFTDVQILYGEYPSRAYSDSVSGQFKIPVNPIFTHNRNHITFHFNRVDKSYPKSVKFKYMLENYDQTWSQPSFSTKVTYGNLPPGEYVFRVMATNKEGSWSEQTLVYPFVVKAPFYQTASFIAGMIILLAGSITLLMYLRVRQRVKKMIETERIRMQEFESLRKEIARDFHDEMGNQLTRIINYVSLLKLSSKESNGYDKSPALVSNGNGHLGQSDLYKKVEESAKLLYAGTRDFIWAIDPVNDELSKLFIYIRDFGEKLFEEKNIPFRAYDEVKELIKLPNGFSREATLIFKEAMTNAFKYSQSSNIRFSLLKVNGHFELSLEDDGIGFDPEKVKELNGLKNIKARAQKIGASLLLESQHKKGTMVSLHFTLTKKQKYGHAV